MTALTTAQLDELERNAHGELAGDDLCVPVPADVTLRLVAIARAALAWRDAKLARQGVQTRASLAETSAEHHAAMNELPAAKEADVLACLNLMSALGPP